MKPTTRTRSRTRGTRQQTSTTTILTIGSGAYGPAFAKFSTLVSPPSSASISSSGINPNINHESSGSNVHFSHRRTYGYWEEVEHQKQFVEKLVKHLNLSE